MSTTTTTPAAPASLLKTIEIDVEAFAGEIIGFFGTNVGQVITDVAAMGAGCAVGAGLIFKVNPANQTATEQDIMAICSALSAELSGTTAPTLAQLQGALSVISPGVGSSWATFAMTLSTGLFNFITAHSGSSWVTVGNDFLKGIQIACSAFLGGAALPSASPVTAPAATA